ncbi:unnamed protein product [Rotaria sp. Silwood2]|nr:unnamed protein product [Rotaria sp. Silwood2]CAF3344566.1 unnamed protein product [Rotaria sp. Silwood2]
MFKDDIELDSILHEIIINPCLFDLSKGRVLYCEILRHISLNRNFQEDLLNTPDVVLLAFHHAAFDRSSAPVIFNDVRVAYNTDSRLPTEENCLQYIDYSAHERQMDMSISHEFWQSQIDGYDFNYNLQLPYDRHRSTTHERSSDAHSVQFSLSNDVAMAFLAYASSHKVTLFQLALAVFYEFLFKLCNNQSDLCVACLNANRYRPELEDLVGMFVATLPYRLQLDPHRSFDELVQQVREKCLSILEHSHYPLRYILADSRQEQASTSFLEIVFDFITASLSNNELILDGAQLEPIAPHYSQVAKFDLMLAFAYYPSSENKKISCSLICSQDLFDLTTVQIIADRFSVLLQQLFGSQREASTKRKLHELSIMLPTDHDLCRQLNDSGEYNSEKLNYTLTELFYKQTMNQTQKLAIELDDQSLTYFELYYNALLLAQHLVKEHHVMLGEIICQCVERSLSMVGSV